MVVVYATLIIAVFVPSKRPRKRGSNDWAVQERVVGRMRGHLILIEGLDRSGKTTQTQILHNAIPSSSLIKFPDRTTKIGTIINHYLTDHNFSLSDQAAHLLFSANRWELAASIEEQLHAGHTVIMDRYIYSGIAYSLAKLETSSLPEMASVEWLYAPDRGLPKPDVTMFLTLDIAEMAARKSWGEERYEQTKFQEVVKRCFLRVLDPNTDPSVAIVDVNKLGIEQVASKIWSIVEERQLHLPTEAPLARLS